MKKRAVKMKFPYTIKRGMTAVGPEISEAVNPAFDAYFSITKLINTESVLWWGKSATMRFIFTTHGGYAYNLSGAPMTSANFPLPFQGDGKPDPYYVRIIPRHNPTGPRLVIGRALPDASLITDMLFPDGENLFTLPFPTTFGDPPTWVKALGFKNFPIGAVITGIRDFGLGE